MINQAHLRAACCDLVAEVARASGKVHLRVSGASMVPVLWPGDQVTVRQSKPSELEPDSIIVFRQNEKLVAHRVMCRVGDCVLVRGDARPRCDHPVKASEVVGRIETVTRNGRLVRLQPRFWQRAAAFVLRRSESFTRIFLRFGPWIQKTGFAEAA